MKGWIYIITNKAMPDLIKVGFSMKDPELRAREFGGAGLPHEYVVAYEALVEEPQSIEQAVHSFLHTHRETKEWFRCAVPIAVAAIKAVAGNKILVENFKQAELEKAETFLREQEIQDRNFVTCPHCKARVLNYQIAGIKQYKCLYKCLFCGENFYADEQGNTSACQ